MGLFDKMFCLFKSKSRGGFQTRPYPGGKIRGSKLPGRNEPCWCGSGLKYKKCHEPPDQREQASKACSLDCGPT